MDVLKVLELLRIAGWHDNVRGNILLDSGAYILFANARSYTATSTLFFRFRRSHCTPQQFSILGTTQSLL